MRIAIGSDEATSLTAFLLDELQKRGYEIAACGALAPGEESDWPVSSQRVAHLVAGGEADWGIVCCWTGTGASIAANKVHGVRAALCADAETARGARRWNNANVLALSLRATAEAVAREILDAWFGTEPEDSAWNRAQLARLSDIDRKAKYLA